MRRLVLVLVASLAATTATAEPPPPVPDGGLVHYKNEPCTDAETGFEGTCYYSYDINKNNYVAFYLDELCMVISQLLGETYVEIWRRGADV